MSAAQRMSQHTKSRQNCVKGPILEQEWLEMIYNFCYYYFSLLWWHRHKSCWCGRKVDLGRSVQETGPVTPASRRCLAQVSRMISCVMSSGLTQLSQLLLSASAANVVPLSVSLSPLGGCCDGGLFLFLEKCPSVGTKETVGLLWPDKRSEGWHREECDQTRGCKAFLRRCVLCISTCAESGLQLRAFVCVGERLFLEPQNIVRKTPQYRTIPQKHSLFVQNVSTIVH